MSSTLKSETAVKPTLSPVVVFIMCATLTLAAWYVAHRSAQIENGARFERSAASLLNSFKNRMAVYTNSLITTRNLFEIKPNLSAHEFHTFVDGMDLKTQFPGIQTIGYVRHTSARELPLVMAQLPYKSQKLDDKPFYEIVLFVESMVQTPTNAIGMDLSVNEERRSSMQKAADLGIPVATSMVHPISSPRTGINDLLFIVFVPHYKKGMPASTVAERREALAGYVYGAFKSVSLFGHVAGENRVRRNRLILRVYDGPKIDKDKLMYSHGDMSSASGQFKKIIKLHSAEHQWTIALAGTNDFALPYSRFYPLVILLIGTLLTIAVTYSSARNVTLYRELDSANRAKSIFLANVSHEIRTPLGIMVGFAELIQENLYDPVKVEEYVSKIRHSGHELTRIIGEVLDISKIEANTLLIENSEFPPQKLIDDIDSIWRNQCEAKGLIFSITKLNGLPEKIYTDPIRLKQILVNLVSNAIKFTEKGSVSLIVDYDGKELSFIVQDTGVGISSDIQLQLFKTFSQGDSSITRKYGGSGLGLALSKQLAMALEGDLVLEDSDMGKGSSFKLTLPHKTIRPEEAKTSPTYVLPIEGLKALKGARILLVEDSRENQILIGSFLKTADAIVETANNGEEGCAKALHGSYDLILMDIQMPVLDGYGAFNRLVKASYSKPVIALTAHALREEKERALQLGFAGYLTKPVDRALLLNTIASILS